MQFMILLVCILNTIFQVILLQEFDIQKKSNNRIRDNKELFEIIDIKKTNTIQITFEHLRTTEIYTINVLEKYCSNWNKLELGSQWLMELDLSNPNRAYIKDAHIICWI